MRQVNAAVCCMRALLPAHGMARPGSWRASSRAPITCNGLPWPPQVLEAHPINAQRVAEGKPPANVVLLRGCGSRLALQVGSGASPALPAGRVLAWGHGLLQ